MRKRLTLSSSIALVVVLGVGPLPGLAAATIRLAGDASNVAARAAGGKNEASKPTRLPFMSKLLSKRPTQNQGTAGTLPGQSATLLPDGRLLKTGGLDQDGPVAVAVLGDSRTQLAGSGSVQLQRARAWHTATILPDGKVLIVGGIGANGQLVDTAEVFDPGTQTSELLTPSLALSSTLNSRSSLAPRVYHTATLLTEGLVLLVGGLSNKGDALNSAQLWDFRTGLATTLRPKLKTGRYNHAATLLSNGDVLLSGGTGVNGAALDSTEMFNPKARRFRSISSEQASDLSSDPHFSILNPSLSASLPEDGAVNVETQPLIALRFSRSLRVDTVNANTITLTGPYGRVETRLIPAEGGMLAFLTPKSPLFPGASYTVSLSGSTDQDNLALSAASIQFVTAFAHVPIESSNDEDWIPNANDLPGDWRTGRADSPWQSLPLQARAGVTALAGRVLTLNGQPLNRVTLRIDDKTARTDKTGRFLLESLTPGHHELLIDGRSASRGRKNYGVFEAGVDIEEGRTNVLSYTIWMTKIDMAHAVTIPSPTTSEVVVTTPRIPGMEVRIPANTVIYDHDWKVVTKISITAIPVDRPPFPLAENVDVPIYFTVQPGGAYIKTLSASGPKGARIIYPNYRNEPFGTRVNFWNYDAEDRGWYVYGLGTVTEGGKQVVPDPGVAVYEFTGAMFNWGNAPATTGPAPCACAVDGDPVDLGTGLFVYRQTDLFLPDVLPLSMARTYRPNDSNVRPFGWGTTHPYAIFLWSANQYQEVDLILPDSARVHYVRISPGTGFASAVFENTSAPTAFYKSKIKWNGAGWDLTLKDGSVYVFGENAPLQYIRDRYGNTITVTHTGGPGGNISQITSPNGRWIKLTYDANNRISQASDSIGRTVNYTYDASLRLWKVTDPIGGVTEYTYDASNRIATVKDARGIVYLTNQYDSNGRVSQQTQADGTTYQFAYTLDGNGKVTQTDVTDPRGNHRIVTFNSSGYPLSDTKGCSCGSGVTYERQAGTNFVTAVVDALNRRTEYSYDSMGNVTSVTRMAGTSEAVTTTATYESSFNQVASVTDPLNHTTSFGYDNKGNLTSATDALNHQTTFTYNSAGQQISATDPLGNTTQFGYGAGDLISVTNPLGKTVSRFVDPAGRVLSATNPLGQTARFEYDSLNRLTRVTDSLQGITQFSYDANGNLLSLTDARSNVTSYVYNNMDRVQTRTDPLNHPESYQYNQNGSLSQHTDRKSQVTNYTYDSLDRLTQVAYADGSTITYTYDSVSRLTQVTDSISGTITYAYDNLDRLLSETTPQGTVSYTYDAFGRRTTMTVPGQSVANYTYDNANRLTQITQASSNVSFSYDAADRRTTLTLPNGVVTEYTYDAGSRVTGLTYKKSGVVLGNLSYLYDAVGRRASVGGSFARTGLPSALSTASYNGANQQTAFGSQNLAFDLNGNLTSDGSNTYTWNARDQLVATAGSVAASFQYDAVGRRRTKTIGGLLTSFLYDGDNVVQEQSGGTANILAAGVDEVFTRNDPSGVTSLIADVLGSTIALTDSGGFVQTQYTYDPFGNASASGTASSNPSQYTGRENDGSGLFYYRARYYSPALQRFISEDPIGLMGGTNQYAYVDNDSVNSTDPFGLERLHPQAGIYPKLYRQAK